MKRFIAALIGAAVVLALASTAFAQGNLIAPHRVVKPVNWRTHTAANGANQGFALDSTITNRLGTQVMVLDTTVGVSMLDAWTPTHPAIVVADSNQIYCTFIVTDAGGSSSTADSLYIMAQASYDGVAWFNLATFLGGTAGATVSRLDQKNATGTFQGVLNKLGASGGTPEWAWNYKFRRPLTAASDLTSLDQYPRLRWIVGFPDAVNYSVRASIMYSTTSGE